MQSPTSPAPTSEQEVDPKPNLMRSRKSIALLVLVLGVLTATGPLATDMYLPAFPQITRELGATEGQIGLTLTAIMLGLSVGQLIIGPMSDAWGRRGPLLVGVALFTVTSVLCVFVPNVTVFIALRFVQGVAGAAGAVVARAVVRDMFQGDDAVRFFSRLALVMMLAPLLAPLVGAQLLLVGPWQLSFWVLAGMSALSFVLVLLWLPESLPPESRQSQGPRQLASTVWSLVRNPRFVGPVLTLGLSFGMLFTYVSAFSFVSQNEFDVSPQTYAWLFAVNSLALMTGTQSNGLLVGRVDTRRRLLMGLVLALVAVVSLLVSALLGVSQLWVVVALLALMMLSVGFIMPNATVSALDGQPASVAGTASALMGSLQFALGGSVASLAGLTPSGEASLLSMSVVMASVAVLSLSAFVWSARSKVR
ncbi:DHA1 family bicyclomycin/chloramphenicol resistance-like MFS transporter [Nocardiopsis terrae]|uniref:DHA1 family bicyclomycin/chloramphenicol resistance-like MFS transporter n=2 Tax=Nocardiopsis terrae TaxID=372655 RepID=A0ABR9HGV7_9ACTN|nr:multidrug effflux MFS transporter [Nocardiopsis terrae]MBE1458260.1 DHA1 family bicyclomycin/chloramphenicol resistance-like MFS transporter [Nocardiopsis terrae]